MALGDRDREDRPCSDATVRLLLLADTHVGVDLTRRGPHRLLAGRHRWGRGPDFLTAYHRALDPARTGRVDAVVHGGDLLYRSRVPPSLVELAVAPLLEIAALGIPVILVPGNHERSRIPYPLLACHRNLHIFHGPRTVVLELAGVRVAFSGFPYARRASRTFPALLAATDWRNAEAAIRLLCVHQAFAGARVGTPEYLFRWGKETIHTRDLPAGFAAVLSGHIHRRQVLREDHRGNGWAAPVIYPGSVQRTSRVERFEPKGYALLEIQPDGAAGTVTRNRFVELSPPQRAETARQL